MQSGTSYSNQDNITIKEKFACLRGKKKGGGGVFIMANTPATIYYGWFNKSEKKMSYKISFP